MANRRAAELSRAESVASSPATSRSASGSSKAPSPTEQKNQTDYQFLNFSHPSQAKASGARKAVRSHVTKQQHQREHAAAAARRAKSYPQPEDQQEPEMSLPLRPHAATFPSTRPVLQLPTASSPFTGTPEASQSPSPLNSPLFPPDQRQDPSRVYPEAWYPYLSAAIEHYLSYMALEVPHLDDARTISFLRSRFIPSCMRDRASQHAVLLMAASHYDNVHGKASHPIDLQQLRTMAMTEVNSALPDETRAISDPMIAAAATLASYEILFGDAEIFQSHMSGLARMVSLRGGLHTLGLDGLLEGLILWVDSNAAQITRSNVYFDKSNFPSNANHPRPDLQRFAGRLPPRRSP